MLNATCICNFATWIPNSWKLILRLLLNTVQTTCCPHCYSVLNNLYRWFGKNIGMFGRNKLPFTRYRSTRSRTVLLHQAPVRQ
uniref:Putative secreted protein n=1 Tax=Anopheles triannulatus TaxID=58253 RepID=A0A2M4B4Y7_9DIPT